MKRTVCQYLNSFVGRTGNIGVRTGHILMELIRRGGDVDCVCRGAQKNKNKQINYYDMGLLGHVPRILNGVRIYLAPNFNHRFMDIRLFEWHALRVRQAKAGVGAAFINHVWDTCPRLIEALKNSGKKVILDVPIAPFTYSKRLVDRGIASKDVLMVDERFMKLELDSFHLADLLLAPSEFVGQELVSAGIPVTKIKVIPFGVAPPNIGHKGREPMPEKGRRDGLDFCFVGNVSPRKGVIDILNAWSGLSFASDRMHFCGRVYPEVRKKIVKEKIRGILLPGYVNPFEYLSKCDVFVFPSWLEGCSKAVLEAMSCGLPVIATHSSGTVVRDGIDGFLVDVGDVGAIREKMQWFKENPKAIAVMGEAAKARAQQYTWKRYAASVVDIYERL